jgi:phosphatidate cytidylyltransferase
MGFAENREGVQQKGIDLKRLVTAAILLPIIVGYIHYLPPFPYFFILLLIVAMVSVTEFFIMYNLRKAIYIPAVFLCGVFFYILCLNTEMVVDSLFVIVSIILLIRLFFITSPSGSMRELGITAVGFLYITTFLSFQWFLREDVMGSQYILLLYGSVWFADSSAYYIGTYLGRNKLYPSISPKKTVEGAIGSIAGGALGAVIVRAIFYDSNDWILTGTLVTGSILGLAAVIGDLVESMFKRDAGVRDSSGIIPGHGGILDKVDGVLFAGPVLYFILRLS